MDPWIIECSNQAFQPVALHKRGVVTGIPSVCHLHGLTTSCPCYSYLQAPNVRSSFVTDTALPLLISSGC